MQRLTGQAGETVHLGFFLVPQFSLMSFSSALEPLRAANRLSGRTLYDWQLSSIDGKPVVASNGIPIGVAGSLDELSKPDRLVVCVGLDPLQYHGEHRLKSRLRYLASHGCRVGGISGGAFLLAHAGLLDGRHCTVHWEYADQFRSLYPRLMLTPDLYVVDGGVFTCSGGTAALDMMLHFVSEHAGPELALAVAEQFIHPRIREHSDHQRMALHTRYRVSSPKLVDVIAVMESTLAEPLGLKAIADRVGLSPRQVERLFRRYIGTAPRRFYLGLRLDRSRTLLQQTSRPIREVALDCGFGSTSQFSHAYRRVFGRTPTDERRTPRRRQVSGPAETARPRPARKK